MNVRERVAEFPLFCYQLLFLQDEEFNQKVVGRRVPYGAVACLAISLMAIPNFGGLAVFSVLLVYALLYSIILMFSVKQEFKKPGKLALCVDNLLLSFAIALVVSVFASTMFAPVIYYHFGWEYLVPTSAIMFGLVFFFHNLRLSVYLFDEPDLDHLFSAQMVPFGLVLFLIYYIMNHYTFSV